MRSGLELRGDSVQEFALSCHEVITGSSSGAAALAAIAECAAPHIEGLFLKAMHDPDEISLQFLELVDQIIFEFSENMPGHATVREYVTENLFGRLGIHCDVMRDPSVYALNLKKRALTLDDTVIIRQRGMAEFLPLLTGEFSEQHALQGGILRALLAFDSDDLLNFYYEAAKTASDIEVASLALLGLKKFGTRFRFWNMLSCDSEERNRLVEFARSFDCDDLDGNALPGNLASLLFVLQHLDSNRALLADERSFRWFMGVLQSSLDVGDCISYLSDLHALLSRILIYAPLESMRGILRSEDNTASLVRAIDFLSREYFHRIAVRLSILDGEFIRTVNALIDAGKLKLDRRHSNTVSYILWKSGGTL